MQDSQTMHARACTRVQNRHPTSPTHIASTPYYPSRSRQCEEHGSHAAGQPETIQRRHAHGGTRLGGRQNHT